MAGSTSWYDDTKSRVHLQGFRYAGLQLQDAASGRGVSREVLCSCGNSFGRHGLSRRCTKLCPKVTTLDAEVAVAVEKKMSIVGRIGSDLQTDICGNVLANIIIYVFHGENLLVRSTHCPSYDPFVRSRRLSEAMIRYRGETWRNARNANNINNSCNLAVPIFFAGLTDMNVAITITTFYCSHPKQFFLVSIGRAFLIA